MGIVGKFGDLFKPKYKKSSVDVRVKAVAELVGDQALMKVAKNDPSIEVRKAAIKRISDPVLLACLASEPDTDMPEATAQLAVSCITDMVVLKRLAMDKTLNLYVNSSAVSAIRNQKLLTELATDTTCPARLAAILRLRDEYTLMKLAMEDSDPEVRKTAANRISNPADLAKLIASNPDTSLRRSLVENRVGDQKMLFNIAETNTDTRVRQLAITKIEDEDCIQHLLQTEPHEWLRAHLVEKMTDQTYLASIASDPHESNGSRFAAINRVSDPAVLEEVITDTKAPEFVRQAAKDRLKEL